MKIALLISPPQSADYSESESDLSALNSSTKRRHYSNLTRRVYPFDGYGIPFTDQRLSLLDYKRLSYMKSRNELSLEISVIVSCDNHYTRSRVGK